MTTAERAAVELHRLDDEIRIARQRLTETSPTESVKRLQLLLLIAELSLARLETKHLLP